MEKHFELTDQEFERQFESCELDPAIFSHEAHLRLAWIHLYNYGIDKSLERIQIQLLRFASSAGDPGKYNKTLTIAAIKAVHHFMLRSKSASFMEFILEFPRLKYNFRELMDAHYGFDIFNSEKARTQYLEPDLLPFD
ncbi:hypothetical protein [Poritiphilus flavus]|uniref:Uncharacterized protein n=1 Tax=Poritiphilus flavus TaxID=2697053 RepID=A0A6L9E9G0_9FLAO|nr:hypothetical protein [Poritiphilus flavus]NAS11241.1 hypothetical protein [Poritiphilus flavus]